MEEAAATALEARYRRCAGLRQRLQEAALRSVPLASVRAQAEQLGLPVGEDMAQIPDEAMAFAFDLAVHTGPPGRPRAIDRLGRRGAEGGEAALVLRALQTAWFSVFRVLGPHPSGAGQILEDALLGGEAWVIDEILAEDAAPAAVLALRLARVQGFCLTTGVLAALDEATLDGMRQVLAGTGLTAEDMAGEARFAQMIYQRTLGVDLDEVFGRRG